MGKFGNPSALGAEERTFKSCHPDVSSVSSIYPYVPGPETETVTETYEYDEKGNMIKMTRTVTKKTQPVYPTPTWTCDASKRWDAAVDKSYVYNTDDLTYDTASA